MPRCAYDLISSNAGDPSVATCVSVTKRFSFGSFSASSTTVTLSLKEGSPGRRIIKKVDFRTRFLGCIIVGSGSGNQSEEMLFLVSQPDMAYFRTESLDCAFDEMLHTFLNGCSGKTLDQRLVQRACNPGFLPIENSP